MCEITANCDLYGNIIPALSEHIDTSNYDKEHLLYSTEGKARLGYFKDETAGRPISEIVQLKPKMYAMAIVGSESICKAKGVPRQVVKSLHFEEYKRILLERKESYCTSRRIQSLKHRLMTVEVTKKALSPWEDKRAWLDWNTSVPYGSYSMTISREKPKKREADPPSIYDYAEPAGKRRRLL